jgi:branched-chain amino acid transport system substrate-binding protein
MHLIYETPKKPAPSRRGLVDRRAKGMSGESPRGPISIERIPAISQNVYIRRVEKVGGASQNVEFDKIENDKDPAK